jgi:uncharacterized protein (DUF608 family)
MASVCARTTIPPGGERTVTFLLGWHFPNRHTWGISKSCDSGSCCSSADRIGNYYTGQYADAWDVLAKTAPRLPRLEADTVAFVDSFCASALPAEVKEAALYNLSTLRSQTCFRTPDGNLYGFEGCHDQVGCCDGSCTHVWNYEQATAFLFGSLARTMRTVEFGHATNDEGMMAFRVHLPLERGPERGYGRAAADGQMGCIMKLYRDWQLSGDDDLLRRLWPQARRTLEFCWLPGSWDADRDGVMEGCQHNTMDVEYYGPNPQMEGWYLGALRAAEEMARYLGETDFAADCAALYAQGRAWTDANLFNGEYYEHEIRPPASEDAIHPALRVGMGSSDLQDPDLQLGAGCLVDQLVGPLMARICGLGDVLDRSHVRKTLRSIMTYNRQVGFHGHFNHMRGYVLGDESALLMASYPRGRRPRRPFPYFTEVMTGFEYAAAVHMLYEGQTRAGLQVIRDIRDRYDGRRRSPFNEAECGHHYARAMASWGGVLALTDFHYSAKTGVLQITGEPGRHFWSAGDAWGTCTVKAARHGRRASLAVRGGVLTLQALTLAGVGTATLPRRRRLRAGGSVTVTL